MSGNQLLDLARNCAVRGERTLEWTDRRITVSRSTGGSPPYAALQRVVEVIIYERFYSTGGVSTTGTPPSNDPWDGDARFVNKLHSANAGDGCWERGWHRRGHAGEVFEKDGIAVQVPAAERQRAEGDDTWSVRVPKGRRRLSPGFYCALLNRPIPAGTPVVRVYWSLTAAGAVPFMTVASRLLNEAGIRGRFKVANARSRFARVDPAVMYLPLDDLVPASASIAAVYNEVRPHLRPVHPALTRPVLPGLSLAADPQGQSFGAHRSAVITEGLVDAHRRGARSTRSRFLHVEAAFIVRGLDPARPYLERKTDETVLETWALNL